MLLLAALTAVHLGASPSVSPDGGAFAFEWADRIFTAPTTGGVARALTDAGHRDECPVYSADGRYVYFRSDRAYFGKIFRTPSEPDGSAPELAFAYPDWAEPRQALADGRVLACAKVATDEPDHCVRAVTFAPGAAEPKLLLDLEMFDAALTADGRQLLFRRFGEVVRYRRRKSNSSLSGEIWSCDLATRKFTRLVADGFDAVKPVPAPDGSGFYYCSNSGSFVRNLHFRGTASRQVTRFTDDEVMDYSISGDGRVAIVQAGADFWRTDLASGRTVRLEISAEDPGNAEHRAAFREGCLKIWRRMGETYYDATMGGVDWNRVREKYLPYAETAATLSEFTRAASLLISEIDASHTGFTPDRANLKYNPASPAATEENSAALARLDAKRDAAYKAKIARRREKVHAATDGAVGYLHIATMYEPGWEPYLGDLRTEAVDKKALVIDIRGNRGGYIADRVLKTLFPVVHASFKTREGPMPYPVSYRGESFEGPIVLLIDEVCGSNAEIFSHAIKSLGRGKLVGRPTQGNVIMAPTEKVGDLGDVLIPSQAVFTKEGVDMERHGAEPDVLVENTPADLLAGRDPQLDAAIRVIKAAVSPSSRVDQEGAGK